MTEAAYTAKDITVLEGLEPVRLRPGMYIGSTGTRGLHHLIYEVVDNSVDEALAGAADQVDIAIHPDSSVIVTDNGRRIPVDVMKKEGKPAAEVVLTVLHAGGTFGDGCETRKTSSKYDGGIIDCVKYLHSQGTPDALHKKVVYISDKAEVGEVEVAMQWNTSYQETLLSFDNNINTHEGGTHLSGFRSALTRTLNSYARKIGELKEKDENLQGEDVREGLTAIISVKLQ